MKQKVLRQTLSGSFTPFTFDVASCSFFVKNFSDDDAYVSLENDTPDAECWKIPSMMAEEVYYNKNIGYYPKTIYVKATGEVEVEALEF